jgi:hypothetical protein
MSEKKPLKERAKEEFYDFVKISVYLAFFFCAITAYTNLLLRQYGGTTLNFAFAVFNALVIAKVILIGRIANLGSGSEGRPLYQTAVVKAFFFGLLVLAFHFLEEFVKRIIRGEPSGTVLHEINAEQLIGRTILVFCTFVPLFAFMEIRRELGDERFDALFFKHRKAATPKPSSAN